MTSQVGIDELERRVAVLEAQAAIRRLIAENERVADAGNLHGSPPPWGDLSVAPQPDEGTLVNRWSSSGGRFVGVGMTEEGFGGYEDLSLADMATMPPLAQWLPRALHYLANEDIEVDIDAGTARGLWYSFEPAVARVDGEWAALFIVGRTGCGFVCEDGEWKLTEIRLEEVFSVRYRTDGGWVREHHVPFGPRNAPVSA